MKLSIITSCALLASQATAFQMLPAATRSHTLALGMFGGAGAGAPTEDNPEAAAQMEQAAKSMGMSVEEYSLAMNARAQLEQTLDSTTVTGGNADTVQVSRDINNPPKSLDIEITEAGKALGQEALSKELVTALKKASEEGRTGRSEAQKKMMAFIAEKMKN